MTRIEELKRANERIAYPLGIATYPELSRAEVRELCALYESELARVEKQRFKYETALMLIGQGYPGAAELASAALAPATETGETK